ncbi:DUF1344 domain-containing protein [Rhizobium sp. CB3090]|uniref:DUF1344 domain-containing protein n=1 Tax=Rhizobium sp. CB3090 TaxID=3039156 RepID=UPI0024B1304D|nr:DUF1344 domain-containing protein [Rhizobium sp. CB3090]WFU07688.1 DUF1344 domain-containing protein [Rhizobium sp. CB3090]
MRVLLVPFAAAALFATATYSSATTTQSVAPAVTTSVLYAGADYQVPIDMKVPALKAGIKVQMLWSQTQDTPRQIRIIR